MNTRTKKPLRSLTVLTNDGEWELFVWHESMYPILDEKATGQFCIFEVSEKEGKDKRIFVSLEEIAEVGKVKYVDNKPVESPEIPFD